jgi:hypothetical protein
MKIGVTGIQHWEKALGFSPDLSAFFEHLTVNDATEQTVLNQYSVIFRQCDISAEHPFYPKASDLKVMRDDTIASVICAQLLLQSAQIQDHEKSEMSLLFANSNFIDNGILDFDTIALAIGEIQKASCAIEKNKSFAAEVSPLVPLRTLTNSTQSFVSQYTQIKGDSTTYGSTCLSAAHALDDAITLMQLNLSKTALLGGSHFANVFSFLNQYLHVPTIDQYAESTSAAIFIVESELQVIASNRSVCLWIDQLLFNEWPESTTQYNRVYCGGALTGSQANDLKIKCHHQTGTDALSLFPYFGSLGCAELGFLLSTASHQLDSKESGLIYLEDVFGSFCCLTVKKP